MLPVKSCAPLHMGRGFSSECSDCCFVLLLHGAGLLASWERHSGRLQSVEDAGLEKVVAGIPRSHAVDLHAQGSEELDREL